MSFCFNKHEQFFFRRSNFPNQSLLCRHSEELENLDRIEPDAFCFNQIQKTISIHARFSIAAVDGVSSSSPSPTIFTIERVLQINFSHNVEIKMFGGFDDFASFRVPLSSLSLLRPVRVFVENEGGRKRLQEVRRRQRSGDTASDGRRRLRRT